MSEKHFETDHFAGQTLCLASILSKKHFVNQAFCQTNILPQKPNILSTKHFISQTFFPPNILTTKHFDNQTFWQPKHCVKNIFQIKHFDNQTFYQSNLSLSKHFIDKIILSTKTFSNLSDKWFSTQSHRIGSTKWLKLSTIIAQSHKTF